MGKALMGAEGPEGLAGWWSLERLRAVWDWSWALKDREGLAKRADSDFGRGRGRGRGAGLSQLG